MTSSTVPHDTVSINHIQGWTLIRPGMSGEAFSTALRDAALVPMGDALEFGGLAYDLSGRPLAEHDDEAGAALLVTIQRATPPAVCAWCQGVTRPGFGLVSHGICPACVTTLERGETDVQMSEQKPTTDVADLVRRLRNYEYEGEYHYPSGLLDEAADQLVTLSAKKSHEREFIIATINAVGDMISKTEAIDAIEREFPLPLPLPPESPDPSGAPQIPLERGK